MDSSIQPTAAGGAVRESKQKLPLDSRVDGTTTVVYAAPTKSTVVAVFVLAELLFSTLASLTAGCRSTD